MFLEVSLNGEKLNLNKEGLTYKGTIESKVGEEILCYKDNHLQARYKVEKIKLIVRGKRLGAVKHVSLIDT